jgi:hypothetical protein
MKTHCTITALFAAAVLFLTQNTPAHAQSSPQEAVDVLRALTIKINQAKQAGDYDHVKELEHRYIDIERKWNVRLNPAPRPAPAPVPAPPPVNRTWSDVRKGEGKITGYKGGKIEVRSAAVTINNFWDATHTVNPGGKGASLKFTTYDGRIFSYSGNWAWRGNLTASLKVGDGEGGFYNGTLNMDKEGIATISLVGYGDADGYNVTFSH